jgi:DNA-directed RNA polymerase subunit RPC12/RpoP
MAASPTRSRTARPATGAVCIECLHCGHRGVISERALGAHGLAADAPIAAFIKRLTCERCGHRSVKAFRTTGEDVRTFAAVPGIGQRRKHPA